MACNQPDTDEGEKGHCKYHSESQVFDRFTGTVGLVGLQRSEGDSKRHDICDEEYDDDNFKNHFACLET